MHPHPDKRHVMTVYRRHILGSKRKWRTARGLIHYRAIVQEYLACKRFVIDTEGK
jgi:hypothetical protein